LNYSLFGRICYFKDLQNTKIRVKNQDLFNARWGFLVSFKKKAGKENEIV